MLLCFLAPYYRWVVRNSQNSQNSRLGESSFDMPVLRGDCSRHSTAHNESEAADVSVERAGEPPEAGERGGPAWTGLVGGQATGGASPLQAIGYSIATTRRCNKSTCPPPCSMNVLGDKNKV